MQIGFPSVPVPLRQLPFDALGQWWTVDLLPIPTLLCVKFFRVSRERGSGIVRMISRSAEVSEKKISSWGDH